MCVCTCNFTRENFIHALFQLEEEKRNCTRIEGIGRMKMALLCYVISPSFRSLNRSSDQIPIIGHVHLFLNITFQVMQQNSGKSDWLKRKCRKKNEITTIRKETLNELAAFTSWFCHGLHVIRIVSSSALSYVQIGIIYITVTNMLRNAEGNSAKHCLLSSA